MFSTITPTADELAAAMPGDELVPGWYLPHRVERVLVDALTIAGMAAGLRERVG